MRRFFSLVLLGALLGACANVPADRADTEGAPPERMQVAASFYPLAFLAERIAGEAADVLQVIPHGVEPHDYEPTPRQLTAVYDTKVLIMNGEDLDPWAERLRSQLERRGITIVVAADEDDDLLPAPEEEEEDDDDDDDHGEFDPHVWLDPLHMRAVAVRVRDAFIAADPVHAGTYTENADRLLADLDALDAYFRTRLQSCDLNTIIVSHDAFGYLARRYEFETIALSGISPHEEPSPRKIAEIIDLVRRENLPVVFFETLVSPKLAETVASGSDARTMVLDPVEGLTSEGLSAGASYLTVMRENADNLAIALACRP